MWEELSDGGAVCGRGCVWDGLSEGGSVCGRTSQRKGLSGAVWEELSVGGAVEGEVSERGCGGEGLCVERTLEGPCLNSACL